MKLSALLISSLLLLTAALACNGDPPIIIEVDKEETDRKIAELEQQLEDLLQAQETPTREQETRPGPTPTPMAMNSTREPATPEQPTATHTPEPPTPTRKCEINDKRLKFYYEAENREKELNVPTCGGVIHPNALRDQTAPESLTIRLQENPRTGDGTTIDLEPGALNLPEGVKSLTIQADFINYTDPFTESQPDLILLKIETSGEFEQVPPPRVFPTYYRGIRPKEPEPKPTPVCAIRKELTQDLPALQHLEIECGKIELNQDSFPHNPPIRKLTLTGEISPELATALAGLQRLQWLEINAVDAEGNQVIPEVLLHPESNLYEQGFSVRKPTEADLIPQ